MNNASENDVRPGLVTRSGYVVPLDDDGQPILPEIGSHIYRKGTILLDPFAGIGGFAYACVNHDLRFVGLELEQKFVDLAQENFALWAREWCSCAEGSGWCDACGKRRVLRPVIMQGDSRQFAEKIAPLRGDGSVTSPPFAGSTLTDPSSGITKEHPELGASHFGGYGHAEGQIADLPLGAVTSPPYANRVDDSGTGPVADKIGTYGEEPGQIGNLRMGAVTRGVYDGIRSFQSLEQAAVREQSVVLGESARNDHEPVRERRSDAERPGADHWQEPINHPQVAQGSGNTVEGQRATGSDTIQLERRDSEAELQEADPERLLRGLSGDGEASDPSQGYGSPQQRSEQSAGTMPSLPSESSQEGILGSMEARTEAAYEWPERMVSAITSPPFADIVPFHDLSFQKHRGGKLTHTLYGDSPSQIGNLSSITSPPFSPDGNQPAIGQGTRKDLKEAGRIPEDSYGETEGQIGQHAITELQQLDENTYWGAVAQVYSSLFEALNPGSYVALVLKGFIRRGEYIDLPAMTLILLTQIGYEPVLWVEAMVIAAESQPSMLGEVPTYRKKRASFFRKLYEAKHPENRIDSEVVLVMRKPLQALAAAA